MNTKAAIILLVALMASSQAISTDEKQKITKDTAPLTLATKSVFVDVGNRKMAMMVLRDGLLCNGVFINGRCVKSAPAQNCVAEGNPCGVLDPCCDGFACDGLVSGVCFRKKPCITEGNPCGLLDPCCDGFICDGLVSGTCFRKKPCVTEGNTCGALDPCCDGLYCDGIFSGNCNRQGLPTPLSSIV